MGYAGGTTPSPTYENIGDHTECVQVDFDPRTVTYERLLGIFWSVYDSRSCDPRVQYASLILTADAGQEAAAFASAAEHEMRTGRTPETRIEPLRIFHLAEGYHQKWYLRSDTVLNRRFASWYPDDAAFTDSTAAARANGLLGGFNPGGSLDELIAGLGLSPTEAEHLNGSLLARHAPAREVGRA